MNEFTKEELEDLECWLRVTRKQDIILPSSKDKEYLEDKIQSLIDNYCEHILYCTGCGSEQKHIYCNVCEKSMKRI